MSETSQNQLTLTEAETKELLSIFQKNPVLHIEEWQGVRTLEEHQKKICRAVEKYDRVAIKAHHAAGKSFILAKLVLWFGSSFLNSKIITTAPTYAQVKRILWSEIRTGWSRSRMPLGGVMLQTEWKMADDWFAVGYTAKQEAGGNEGQGTASSFQGIHSGDQLIILDEGPGISAQIWQQVEGMMTSGNSKLVVIGNPTSRSCEFFKCFQDMAFHKITISCFDSPNMRANGFNNIGDLHLEIKKIRELNDEAREDRLSNYKIINRNLLNPKWVIQMGAKWGLDHPLFVSKVLGEFPQEDDRVLINLGVVEKAQQRWEHLKSTTKEFHIGDPFSRVIGVDCARYGSDKTVIVMLEDEMQEKREVVPKTTDNLTNDIVGAITNMLNARKAVKNEQVVVDGSGGYGSGVVDGLRANISDGILRSNIQIREVLFGSGVDDEEDKKHFSNLKAKMYKMLADSLNDDLAIMPEQVYLEELPTIRYEFNKKGQMIIESKDDYKKRTGLGSPDDSDALVLANYGRLDIGRPTDFTDDTEKLKKHRPMAAGIRSGDKW